MFPANQVSTNVYTPSNYSLPQDFSKVTQLVKTYIEARDAFNQAGGKSCMSARREVRSLYCNAKVSPEALTKWIDSVDKSTQGEFNRRFTEWNRKLEIGKLQKSETQTLSEGDFLKNLQAYYDKYTKVLTGQFFANLTSAKHDLRECILPKLANTEAEAIAKEYNITDSELTQRMGREWSWKAPSIEEKKSN